jgi:hypothetical protein
MSNNSLYVRDADPASRAKKPSNRKGYRHANGEYWFKPQAYSNNAMPEVVEQPPRLYKVLRDNGVAPIASGNFKWPLPTATGPGEWVEMTGPISMCERGYHAFDGTQWEHWYGNGQRLFEIEFDGPVGKQSDKYIGARARLVREIPQSVLAEAPKRLDRYNRPPSRQDVVNAAIAVATAKVAAEFNGQQAQAVFDKAKAKLGAMATEAEKALSTGRATWEVFEQRVRYAKQYTHNALDSAKLAVEIIGGDVPEALKDMDKQATAIANALPTLTWGSAREPWKADQVTYAAVQKVGAAWYADYSKRAAEVIKEAGEKAGAEFDAKPQDKPTFDTLVDAALAATPEPTIPGTLADVQAKGTKAAPKRRGRS